ncbi:hypothetical protein UK23_17975 [Lentzea aerocolonigenes]|uniref:Uncharacterized protein n=1 Tax=Lentzea aerocolonigenes TaxID=68170 RepID=A0A0F0GXS3_LENAE|nr:hypothetical protein UK23_17975 [Lentzea aerocolonigenes]
MDGARAPTQLLATACEAKNPAVTIASPSGTHSRLARVPTATTPMAMSNARPRPSRSDSLPANAADVLPNA